MSNVIGLKLANSFLDVIGKVNDDFNELETFSVSTFNIQSACVIQMQQVKNEDGNVSMAPQLMPLNMFAGDLGNSNITLKSSDVLFFFDPDTNLENYYRESIGDVTVSSQKVYMP